MLVNVSSVIQQIDSASFDDDWKRPARASCQILKWIGVYLCFAFLSGIILNALIIYILLKKQRSRSPIDIYIIALCSADFTAALLGIPLPLTSNLACRWLYGKYLCYYEGFIAYFAGMVGLYLLMALSLNRYWIIVTPKKEHYVTVQKAYVAVVLSLLGGLFWSLAPVIGWNHYRQEGVGTSCSIQWQSRSINVISYNVCMFIFAYIIPLGVMLYCNLRIYRKVRLSTQHKATWNKTVQLHKSKQKHRQMEQRMAKTIFFIIVTFITAWTPYAFVAFISSFISPSMISPLGGTLPAIFAKSSVYFNPLVFILSNSSVRAKILSWRSGNRSNNSETDSTGENIEVINTSKGSRLTSNQR